MKNKQIPDEFLEGFKEDIHFWDPEKKYYKEYQPPKKWKVTLRAELEDIINCAACGTEVIYGDAYTSRFIHNHIGLGYSVCKKCYIWETKEEKKQEIRKRKI